MEQDPTPTGGDGPEPGGNPSPSPSLPLEQHLATRKATPPAGPDRQNLMDTATVPLPAEPGRQPSPAPAASRGESMFTPGPSDRLGDWFVKTGMPAPPRTDADEPPAPGADGGGKLLVVAFAVVAALACLGGLALVLL